MQRRLAALGLERVFSRAVCAVGLLLVPSGRSVAFGAWLVRVPRVGQLQCSCGRQRTHAYVHDSCAYAVCALYARGLMPRARVNDFDHMHRPVTVCGAL